MSTLYKHANININNLFFLEKSEFFLGRSDEAVYFKCSV
ncbi:hypothetical protein Ptc2401_00194 [Prosthecochloris sp. CIB 2401]|nr:hypothetical protein Ptc2401_00194 [Prosthecochloris sp. CIB 2401]